MRVKDGLVLTPKIKADEQQEYAQQGDSNHVREYIQYRFNGFNGFKKFRSFKRSFVS